MAGSPTGLTSVDVPRRALEKQAGRAGRVLDDLADRARAVGVISRFGGPMIVGWQP
jgi:hypothetical protein